MRGVGARWGKGWFGSPHCPASQAGGTDRVIHFDSGAGGNRLDSGERQRSNRENELSTFQRHLRRRRTHLYGGVGGERSRGLPRSACALRRRAASLRKRSRGKDRRDGLPGVWVSAGSVPELMAIALTGPDIARWAAWRDIALVRGV